MKTNKNKKQAKWTKYIVRILILAVIAFSIYWLVTNWDSFFNNEELPPTSPQAEIQVTYFLNNEEYRKQYYSDSDELQLLANPQLDNDKVFLGWYDEDEEKIDTNLKVTDNINIYGYSVKPLDYKIYLTDRQKNTLQDYTGNDEIVIIPSSYSVFKGVVVEGNDCEITALGWYMFPKNSNLTTVYIPSSITEVDKTAFKNCDNLINVYVESEFVYNHLTYEDNVGGLMDKIRNLYIKADIDDGSNTYLNTQYDKQLVNGYNLYTIKQTAEFTVTFYDYWVKDVIDTRTYASGEQINSFPEVVSSFEVENLTGGYTTIYYFQYWIDSEGALVTEETIVTNHMLVYAFYKGSSSHPPVSKL